MKKTVFGAMLLLAVSCGQEKEKPFIDVQPTAAVLA